MNSNSSDGRKEADAGAKVFLGVFREAEHSPERVEDDELILRAVAEKLSNRGGCSVELVYPAELDESLESRPPDLVFNMAEEEPVLSFLEGVEERGARVVNSTAAVRNTFRKQMTGLLTKVSFFPETFMVSTSGTHPQGMGSVWVKRGDYHAISRDDVIFAADDAALKSVIDTFRARGIETVAIQRHVPGDLIKFYGVRKPFENTLWFHWFYHKGQELGNYEFDEELLRKRCEESSDLLGLEIFGGDAIVTSDGEILVIDVNAWPSFALFRDTASGHISSYLFGLV